MSSSAPKVFISYRREETAGHAGRIYDAMSSRFGDGNVFMDVDMAPGVDFVQRIKDAVGGCHVLLVIIGPRWSTITNGTIAPRLADPDDFVRLEVEEGLRRADVTVIPVLVGGARMPDPSELPRELHSLSRRNALELSDTRWRYDVDRLLTTLDRLISGTSTLTPVPGALRTAPAAPQPGPPEPRVPEEPGVGLALSAALVAAAAGIVGRGVGELVRTPPKYDELTANGHVIWTQVKTSERVDQIADGLLRNGLTWAVITAAVGVWLTVRLRSASTAGGRLASGALVGALGVIVGSAVHAVPTNMVKVKQLPLDQRQLLLVVVVAITGGVAGAYIGWVWGRRAWAGFAAGLVAGALEELIVIKTGWSGPRGFVAKAAVAGFVIVLIVSLVQVAMPRASRGSPRE